MFKRKYLKQLHDVQTRIRNCTATLAKLKMPTNRYNEAKEITKALQLAMGWFVDFDMFLKRNNYELNYLEELGNYFINISKYSREKFACNSELYQLREEERCLKEKLGID